MIDLLTPVNWMRFTCKHMGDSLLRNFHNVSLDRTNFCFKSISVSKQIKQTICCTLRLKIRFIFIKTSPFRNYVNTIYVFFYKFVLINV